MNLWLIFLYISNWPGEAKGHYGILQQDIFVNRSVLWETIALTTLGAAIGLHQSDNYNGRGKAGHAPPILLMNIFIKLNTITYTEWFKND